MHVCEHIIGVRRSSLQIVCDAAELGLHCALGRWEDGKMGRWEDAIFQAYFSGYLCGCLRAYVLTSCDRGSSAALGSSAADIAVLVRALDVFWGGGDVVGVVFAVVRGV